MAPSDNERCGQAVAAETSDEGAGFPVPLRNGRDQAVAAQAAAPKPRHVGLGPGLVDEHQPCWVQAGLLLAPGRARFGDIGPILLRRAELLFLCVRLRRSRAVQTEP
jgi:hypothetical protein